MVETEPEKALVPRGHRKPRAARGRLWAWIGPLLVTLFAGFLRFDKLGSPHAVVFDETYYAKDAYALLRFGHERYTLNEPEGIANKLFLEGDPDQMWSTAGGSFIAHPPVGKWMIALGEHFLGVDPFGWRFMAALCGTLSVLILCRVAIRMTGNTLLGCAAGFLMALDGLHLVLSRTALLDIFLLFWLLAGFACLVNDRDRSRRVLADGRTAGLGRWVLHPWRLAAGVCFGLAAGVKWSAVPMIAAFVLLVLLWDVGARRVAGVGSPGLGALFKDGWFTLVGLVVVPVVVYVASWSGWLLTTGGWGRGQASPNVAWRMVEGLPKLWEYHRRIWNYHVRLDTHHDYQSWPWDWQILRRPVAFYWNGDTALECGGENCVREILGLGTPAIWWAGVPALLAMVLLYASRRDWRAGTILLAYGAGWLAWFPSAFEDRTMFFFYALPLLPFVCLALVLCLGAVIGPVAQPRSRRAAGAVIAGGYVLLVLVNFWYLYPILAAKSIPYDVWHAHMWLKSWI